MRIAVIGPESTGKTMLCQQLAEHLSCMWIPEYARSYVEALNHPYEKSDVEAIAHKQIEQLSSAWRNDHSKPLNASTTIFDTDLIITQVWLEEVFGECPLFVREAIANYPVDFYLLLYPDLPFIPDPVRENPNRREYLFARYEQLVKDTHIPYAIIRGAGFARFSSALSALSSNFSNFSTSAPTASSKF